jgi:hypothetical protein
VKDLRSKIAVAAVIFGLGGLGGFAIASNPASQQQVPAATIASQTGHGAVRVSTGASGALGTPGINTAGPPALPRATLIGGRSDD